ncbi:JAB domain-containing protein [Klebsiella michiganensis]|uniref:JAB domain-containing protein n=1 Tax=Klebsiella michiganensis TaxID=1134687 RepID=UPI001909136F|nr:JAB domain-containing protein [Klebsiella michiganensis]QQO68456.1 JAB domain-containing protein [Klebsiella michiganensis]
MHYTSESSQNFTLQPSEQRAIKRALSILDKHLREPGIAFTSTQSVRDWLRLKMVGLEREEFMVLYLSQQHQLTGYETLFTGTINSTEVHPREVVKRALYFNAAAVIFAHNHPSGEITPSQADKNLTQRLVNILQVVDIRVLDRRPSKSQAVIGILLIRLF